MKRTLHTALKIAMVLWTLAVLPGCVKNEPQGVRKEVMPISFNAVVGSNAEETKAFGEYPNKVYPTSVPFGSAAFPVTDVNLGEAYIPHSEVSYGTNMTIGGEGVWTTSQAYYWPDPSDIGKLRFFSYSPWDKLNSISDITGENGIVIYSWDVGRNQTVDVLYAEQDIEVLADGKNTKVPTEFKHALSQIVGFTIALEIPVKPDPADASPGDLAAFEIVEISVDGLNTVGDFYSGKDVLSDEQWKNSKTPKNYVWYNGRTYNEDGSIDKIKYGALNNDTPSAFNHTAGEGYKSYLEYLLVLPQTVENETACITVKYAAKVYSTVGTNPTYSEYTADSPGVMKGYLKGSTIGMGQKITYSITIKNDRTIYWAPSIQTWTPGSFEIM